MAMITELNCNLREAVHVKYLDGNLFSQDVYGNAIRVIVMDGDEPATLAGTVSGTAIREDGSTVALTDSRIDENVATVVLPAAAYAVPGVLAITIKISDTNTVTTLAYVVANVYRTSTDTVVDPGTIIPSITTLIEQIAQAVASIPADYSSLWAALAETFNASKSGGYAVGEYVTYDGGLYRFKNAHTGSWSSSDVDAVNLGSGIAKNASDISDLKSAFSDYVQSTYLTPTYNRTEQGVTCKVENDALTVYGTCSTQRRFLYLNGQDAVKNSSNVFSKTLDAGTYLIESDFSGTSTTYRFDATYSTFANGFILVNQEEKVKTITFTAPVMIGFSSATNKNYGTSESPTIISFSAKRITAKDIIARGEITEVSSKVNELFRDDYIDFTTAPEQKWTVSPGGTWVPWTDEELARSYVFGLQGANNVIITGGTSTSIIAFLKSYAPVNGVSVDFSAEYTSRISIQSGTTVTYTIPSDALYLYVLKSTSDGTDCSPSSLSFRYASANPYSIYPTNDTTDRTAEVERILSQFGICHFEKGRYYVKNVHMPDNAIVEGCGASSEIVLGESTTGELWTYGDKTFTRFVGVNFDAPLPSGKYTFSADVASTDTDSTECAIIIYFKSPYTSANAKYYTFSRGTGITIEFEATYPFERIELCASNNLNNAIGDTGTFTNISFTGIQRAAAFIVGSQCTVRDIRIRGSLSSVTKSTNGFRNGILFQGTYSFTDSTIYRGVISGCFMDNFTGGCICLIQTGQKVYSGYNIDNCYLMNSYAGIDIPIHSEFHRVSNCTATGCYYGVLNNGGNNEFTGCSFSGNEYGFAIDNSDGTRGNNAHGGMSGCVLQHNHVSAIYVNNSGAGFVFTGINLDNNTSDPSNDTGITIIDSTRLVFAGCNFMAYFSLIVSGAFVDSGGNASGLVIFNGCSFRDGFTGARVSIENPQYVKFNACYKQDGTEVNPTAS